MPGAGSSATSRAVLITGCSSGIGWATAERLDICSVSRDGLSQVGILLLIRFTQYYLSAGHRCLAG